ncbi:ribosomal rna-processing protein 8-like [Stylonychia lemnae]|uniref:Ribosomal RNA-processing protein 8 n=1 Tax=Stylonychia lemnae TaxID=5949 RepID=A0A078ABT4_STYLE|nr:ribosomal rna-processing protein 8-like [Stylonychia lemnae]|eukprot:CDW79649.1 ribosomal rna-processing protein 8-like [Stylonychia lemnae]
MDKNQKKREVKLQEKQQKKNKNVGGSSKQKNEVKDRIQEGMMSSKFRFLNEQLYTSESAKAIDMFKENPQLFEDVKYYQLANCIQYHTGYRHQVDKWPKNPLDIIIDELKKDKYKTKNIGDFGCGEGRLEVDLKASGHLGKIYSFDAGKMSDHIVQCDIAHVPVKNNHLDIGVFSLSLMGTNFTDFLREANRVIKPDGRLFIAEVMSRFPDINDFVKRMRNEVGFRSLKVNKLKDYFYVMVFEKEEDANKLRLTSDFKQLLTPCKYKKR